MARMVSTSTAVGLSSFRPSSLQYNQQPPRFANFSYFQNKNHGHRIFCQTNTDSVDSTATEEKRAVELESEIDGNAGAAAAKETTSSTGAGFPEYPDKNFNRRIAVVSAAAAVGLFLSGRLELGAYP
ncbi:UNVERIFIED_CONTAM: hypothetical protein Sradi_0658800 [Sesamum radiatum]|uniref:Uncharacterized protein n=1 Tax=Sesamum radiatum TaxID=300843 RepID=A0AAW2VM21_SESRA